MNKIILMFIAAVVIIGGLVVFQQLNQEKQEEIEAPQVHRDAKGRFELSYPSDWHIFLDTVAGDLFVKGSLTLEDIILEKYTGNDCFIVLMELANPEGRNLSDFEENYASLGAKKTKLGELVFLRWEMKTWKMGKEFSKSTSYIVINNNNTPFLFSVINKIDKGCQEEAENILSSLVLY